MPLKKWEGDWSRNASRNRPFYRYGRHIELLDLRSILGYPGGTRSVLARVFLAKREFQCIFLGKKTIIITSKHGTKIFFFFSLQSFLGKVKEKLARKANVNTNASISDRVHTSWASNNTPTIQLIQYVRRIGKKVYCFWDRYY